MKKLSAFLLAFAMLFALCACGPAQDAEVQEEGNEGGADIAKEFATEFDFVTSEEDTFLYGLIFEEDVTVTGGSGRVVFADCEFRKNIYNCGGEGAKVVLDEACVLAETSECIIDSTLEEAGDDTDLPKFMYFCPGVKVSCGNCGAAVTNANIPIVFNGETYPVDSAQLFVDEASGLFEEYSGQEAAYHNRCTYMQDGARVDMHVAVAGE